VIESIRRKAGARGAQDQRNEANLQQQGIAIECIFVQWLDER